MTSSIRMVVVLSLIALVSGVALGGLYSLTREQAENNVLKFKKIPAVVTISETITGPLDDAAHAALEAQLLAEKRAVDIGAKEPLLFFVISKDGAPYAVALEGVGQGFGGDLGVMAGIAIESGDLVGIGVTTMSETPGVGTRVKDPAFAKQFVGMAADAVVKVKKDGGVVDAVSGATISSRAVSAAVTGAKETFEQHRDAIVGAVNR